MRYSPLFKKLLFVGTGIAAMLFGAFIFSLSRYDFVTLEGDKYRWQQLQGQWVVVNYFAEWCAPCLREMPELNQFHRQHKDNIVLLGMSFDQLNTQELVALKEKYDIQFPMIATDPVPAMLNAMPKQLPTTYLISPEGNVVKRLLGEQTEDSLLKEIEILSM